MDTSNIYICLENIRSLHNVGAIFRTCSFFGLKKIILLGYTAKPKEKNKKSDKSEIFNDELLKTSLGSENDIEIIRINNNEELLKFVKENNLNLISIEQSENSIKLDEIKESTDDKNHKYQNIFKNSIIVFGNETEGINKEILNISNYIIEIKRLGKHNSLNVATTAGIILNKIIEI